MSKITQKDISNKIRELINPQDNESGILPLLRVLASKTAMPPTQPTQGATIAPASPTMPNIVGKQQLMESNEIAQRYPYLGAR